MVSMSFEGKSPRGFGGDLGADDTGRARDGLTITCVTLNQLSEKDVAQMDEARTRALDAFEKSNGVDLVRKPITEELNYLPEGMTPLDKLIVRAYEKDTLVAYAHVLSGWPRATEWTVEQLILDPQHRLQGIGTKVIQEIESLASSAEIRTTAILSVPTRPGAASFWNTLGYQDSAEELGPTLGQENLRVMRKGLY